MKNLLKLAPEGTEIIHFCCDNYNGQSLKLAEQDHRYRESKSLKVYEANELYNAPSPLEYFHVSANKAYLLAFLCDTWCVQNMLKNLLESECLYLSVGFLDIRKSVLPTRYSVADIPALESTH